MADLDSAVWMVHGRTPPEGVKGTLTLEPRGVVFRPAYEPGNETVFAMAGIRRARRALGSPVLELRLRIPGLPALVGFYFVRPPSLETQRKGSFLSRGRARRDAAAVLIRSNVAKKDEVVRWVRAIREATKER